MVSTGSPGAGISLPSGGTITNAPSGFITGYTFGIDIAGTEGTVTNQGTLVGSASG